jgi:hypothetical protein
VYPVSSNLVDLNCLVVLDHSYKATTAIKPRYPTESRRYSKWEKDGVLSFIPPDGKFRLLEYQVAGSSQVPISLRPQVKVEEHGGAS